jgi:hypothetical protein
MDAVKSKPDYKSPKWEVQLQCDLADNHVRGVAENFHDVAGHALFLGKQTVVDIGEALPLSERIASAISRSFLLRWPNKITVLSRAQGRRRKEPTSCHS